MISPDTFYQSWASEQAVRDRENEIARSQHEKLEK